MPVLLVLEETHFKLAKLVENILFLTEGNQTADGTSIRVIHDGLFVAQQHILSLALSMGYANFVECEITGVVCLMMHVGESVTTESFQNKVSVQSLKHDKRCECHSNLSEILE